jgi:hypothetical protein
MTPSSGAATTTTRNCSSQPPLTEEKGIGVVLKFLATQPGFANAKNAKAEDFFDNSVLLELQREGYLARFK